MNADQPAVELLGELPKKSKCGRPRKPITQAMIAEHIGYSRRALYRRVVKKLPCLAATACGDEHTQLSGAAT